MAKTLKSVGTTTLSADTRGRDFTTPIIFNIADASYVGQSGSALDDKLSMSVPLPGVATVTGHVKMELIDVNGATVAEVKDAYDKFLSLRVILSTEVGAAAAGSLNNLTTGTIHHIVDAASFATGKIKVSVSGDFGQGAALGFLSSVAPVGIPVTTYLETRELAGQWNIEYNFTVTE